MSLPERCRDWHHRRPGEEPGQCRDPDGLLWMDFEVDCWWRVKKFRQWRFECWHKWRPSRNWPGRDPATIGQLQASHCAMWHKQLGEVSRHFGWPVKDPPHRQVGDGQHQNVLDWPLRGAAWLHLPGWYWHRSPISITFAHISLHLQSHGPLCAMASLATGRLICKFPGYNSICILRQYVLPRMWTWAPYPNRVSTTLALPAWTATWRAVWLS